jgi:hypothetical protein
VIPGRFTAHVEGPFVVFIIGMRINKLFAFRKWWPVASAMQPMIQSLFKDKSKGFLGAESFFYWPGAALFQYWRSFEDLERFSRDPGEPHLEAWRRFNRAIGTDGSVGIWHETYTVEPGRYEVVYNNMPPFGLARASEHLPASGRRETARRRLGGEGEPAVPTPAPPPGS